MDGGLSPYENHHQTSSSTPTRLFDLEEERV
jgi:hypothetical protein